MGLGGEEGGGERGREQRRRPPARGVEHIRGWAGMEAPSLALQAQTARGARLIEATARRSDAAGWLPQGGGGGGSIEL